MTRINCVPVTELTDQHLIAEYRELPRVFRLVRNAQERGRTPQDYRSPTRYTLGSGHVKFFYTRLGWCLMRQHQLINEMKARGFIVRHDEPWRLTEGIRAEWFNGWSPWPEDLEVNRRRLIERGSPAENHLSAPKNTFLLGSDQS